MVASGKAERVEIVEMPPQHIETRGLSVTLQIGPDLKRLAVKMGSALASLLPSFSSQEIDVAIASLSQSAHASGHCDARIRHLCGA